MNINYKMMIFTLLIVIWSANMSTAGIIPCNKKDVNSSKECDLDDQENDYLSFDNLKGKYLCET